MRLILVFITLSAILFSFRQEQQPIVIGGKNFNEGYLLTEIMAQTLEAAGFQVERKAGLGGTLVCFSALENGEIDAYPEYSGTIEQAILNLQEPASYDSLATRLQREHQLVLLPSFGFNNTYALAAKRERARELGLRKISDLRTCTACKLGFSSEFLRRQDGWIGLRAAYDLPQQPRGMEHGLAYIALESGEIDITDAYSTDGDIPRYDLRLLEDDRKFFPTYLAAPLVRADLPADAKKALQSLAGTLDETKMQQLNAEIVVHGRSYAEVAHQFLMATGVARKDAQTQSTFLWQQFWSRTVRHIFLTLVSLAAGLLIAVPAGIAVYRIERIARPVIYFTGLLQTIPSIALLGFMIPLLGIGVIPAIVALFLYALLPILRNTAIGLFAVDPLLKKVALGMGMTGWQRLRHVELPLAAPTILAGIKTAAVITVGTATLAALIGAGGLGEYIFTGIALNRPQLILQGAFPAAGLAIIFEFAFELIERLMVPAHLLEKATGKLAQSELACSAIVLIAA